MHRITVALLMLSQASILVGCEERGFNIKLKVSGDQAAPGGNNPGREAQFKSHVNIKTGEELRHTFARLTGISPEQNANLGRNLDQALGVRDVDYPGNDDESSAAVNVASIFARTRPLLTINNELSGLSEFKQLAIMKLAAGFCHQVACSGSTAYLPGVASTTISQAYGTAALRQQFAAALLNQLLGPAEQEEIVSRTDAVNDVADYVADIVQSPSILPSCTNVPNPNENAKVRNVAKAACTLVLSSMPVTKL